MTPQRRRELLGDDAITESRRIAATAEWPDELIADLLVLLRAPRHDDRRDRDAAA